MQPSYIPEGNYHTIPEIAGMYNVTRRTVIGWLDRGELQGIKTGIGWLIEVGQLEVFNRPRVGRPPGQWGKGEPDEMV